ncbi:hypothetical protein KK120_18685 [Virgibacillus dakarensis]|nr:hypothetical protein [Virgibacillus dakarensis]
MKSNFVLYFVLFLINLFAVYGSMVQGDYPAVVFCSGASIYLLSLLFIEVFFIRLNEFRKGGDKE